MGIDPEELFDRVGRRIGELRRGQGITQEEIAAEIGMETNNYQRIEAGRNTSLRTLVRIANALDVDPQVLLQQPTEPRPTRGKSKLAKRKAKSRGKK